LVRSQQHRLRDGEAERLGGFEIDDQLELGGLFDGEIGRLRAPEDFVHLDRSAPEQIGEIRAIAHQATRLRMIPSREKRRESVPDGQLGDSFSRSHVGAKAEHDNGLCVLASDRREGVLQVRASPRRHSPKVQLERARRLLQGRPIAGAGMPRRCFHHAILSAASEALYAGGLLEVFSANRAD